MQIKNVFRLLDQETAEIESVGICFNHLIDSKSMSFYVIDIYPGKSITARSHIDGPEIYVILRGQGMMHSWAATAYAKSSQLIKRGDTFTVMPGSLHQLENNGITKLVLLFACHPESSGGWPDCYRRITSKGTSI